MRRIASLLLLTLVAAPLAAQTTASGGIPYIAWNFHMRCPPNLLVDNTSDGCGLAATTGYSFPRTSWGDLLHDHLAVPW